MYKILTQLHPFQSKGVLKRRLTVYVVLLPFLILCVKSQSVSQRSLPSLLETRVTTPIGLNIVIFLAGQLICQWRLESQEEEDLEDCDSELESVKKARDDCLATQSVVNPPMADGLTVSPGGNTPGTERTYSCTDGSAITGETSTVCKNDGSWSLGVLPTC